jgi:hypothetical protein
VQELIIIEQLLLTLPAVTYVMDRNPKTVVEAASFCDQYVLNHGAPPNVAPKLNNTSSSTFVAKNRPAYSKNFQPMNNAHCRSQTSHVPPA